MTDDTHLTEAERQSLADGTLAADERRPLLAHLSGCRECSADVDALMTVMARFREAPEADAPTDALWPGIRHRIEERKVIPLSVPGVPSVRAARRAWTTRALVIAGAAACAVMAVVLLRPSRVTSRDAVATVTDTTTLRFVDDSVKSYAEEARALLNRLEVQRAMMRPEAAAVIDADLKTIDAAIAELESAIANDPRNPALRRLLASSYRQKVELLKRAGNAS